MKACYIEFFKENKFCIDTKPMPPKDALRFADLLAELLVKANPNTQVYRDEEADRITVDDGYEIWVFEPAKNEDECDTDHRHIIVK